MVVAKGVRDTVVLTEKREFLHWFLCVIVWILAFTLGEVQNH